VKCFRQAAFNYHEDKSEECEEDTDLNGVIRSLSLDVQKDLASVEERKVVMLTLLYTKKCFPPQMKFLKKFFGKWKNNLQSKS
jgi:hypothetical protein